MGWLSIGAIGNAVIILVGGLIPIPRWLGVFALAYAITAVISTFKLWKMDKSGLLWLRSWMAVCFLMIFAMIPTFADIALGGIPGIIGFAAFSGVLFWLLNGYVSKRVTGET